MILCGDSFISVLSLHNYDELRFLKNCGWNKAVLGRRLEILIDLFVHHISLTFPLYRVTLYSEYLPTNQRAGSLIGLEVRLYL